MSTQDLVDCACEAPDSGEARTRYEPSGAVRLSRLPAGRTVVLCRIGNGGAASARLADLGFVPGTRIELIRRAPLGDPMELSLRGAHFCLRGDEADSVWVHPSPDAP
jgi:Fe2+ transport system protein FeoA